MAETDEIYDCLVRACRGDENTFTMSSRNLGKLVKCYVGLVENDSVASTTKDSSWHCNRVIVTNDDTADR